MPEDFPHPLRAVQLTALSRTHHAEGFTPRGPLPTFRHCGCWSREVTTTATLGFVRTAARLLGTPVTVFTETRNNLEKLTAAIIREPGYIALENALPGF